MKKIYQEPRIEIIVINTLTDILLISENTVDIDFDSIWLM